MEWIENSKILARMFPDLFLSGERSLSSGPISRDYVDHFMHYWDGRFEKSTQFITVLFNQLQRHAAVQKAARVGITHNMTMVKFGKLASTLKFKATLKRCRDNPKSKEAIASMPDS